MRLGLAMCTLLVLGFGCGKKAESVTREQCSQVADHVTELIMTHMTAHPDELWASVTSDPAGSTLPKEVTKESLPSFITTPEGKTWMMQLRGHVRTGTEQGIEGCVKKGTPALVKCLLAAKTKADVNACDARK